MSGLQARRQREQRCTQRPSPLLQVQHPDCFRDVYLHCVVVVSVTAVPEVADSRHVVCNDHPQTVGHWLEDAHRQSEVSTESQIQHLVGSHCRVQQACFGGRVREVGGWCGGVWVVCGWEGVGVGWGGVGWWW